MLKQSLTHFLSAHLFHIHFRVNMSNVHIRPKEKNVPIHKIDRSCDNFMSWEINLNC